MNTVIQAFGLVFQWDVMIAIIASAFYGLTVGALPSLSATMATVLLVPVTVYLSPIAAVATIITASAMAIFSGDIPGCLLRIPGTPASAAYTDEAYAMTRKGEAETALEICLWFSAHRLYVLQHDRDIDDYGMFSFGHGDTPFGLIISAANLRHRSRVTFAGRALTSADDRSVDRSGSRHTPS